MGVGIPGTGMIGLPIAIALGALIGCSDYQLEVLKDLDAQSLELGKQYVKDNHINIGLKADACDKLYIEVDVVPTILPYLIMPQPSSQATIPISTIRQRMTKSLLTTASLLHRKRVKNTSP